MHYTRLYHLDPLILISLYKPIIIMKKTDVSKERDYAAPEMEEISFVSNAVMDYSDPENPVIPEPDE